MNRAWKKILNACLDNELFYVKCTTARVSGSGKKFPKFLIRVFTKDWRDIQELVRVRQKLMELGFDKPLCYKREVDFLNKVTGEGEYYIDEKKDGLLNNVEQVMF